MDNLTVIVLAAGGGTRMKSKTMKVLHPIGGRSMIGHVLAAVQAVEPRNIVAVVGHQREQVGPHIQALVPGVVLAVQETQDGTGHAVRVAVEGKTVGHLSRSAASTFRTRLQNERVTAPNFTCKANIRGGWMSENKESGMFGIYLDVCLYD